MRDAVRVGIIGGGLMGREAASAFGRWFALEDYPIRAELTAVCDVSEKALEWFRKVPTVRHFTTSYQVLLATDVDVVYVAVPHDLHEEIYSATLRAGKDLLAEKPFGIDLSAAERLMKEIDATKRFVRCGSEFPYFPAAQRLYEMARSGKIGRLLEVRAGFWHSSDLDPTKPANWKRRTESCGQIGVMGDLGLHTLHIPLRLGWQPTRVYAQLQKGYPERPDGKGGMVKCDTWDNAMLHTDIKVGDEQVPMRLEMKRMAPGETNTWFIEVLGTEGGAKFSTKEPKTLWLFKSGKEQSWDRIDLGSQGPFKTITGGIFEPGFSDCLLQMWAAYLAERAGALGDRIGCVTPQEAVESHRVFAAALESNRTGRAAKV